MGQGTGQVRSRSRACLFVLLEYSFVLPRPVLDGVAWAGRQGEPRQAGRTAQRGETGFHFEPGISYPWHSERTNPYRFLKPTIRVYGVSA